jgi:hypothetical protein
VQAATATTPGFAAATAADTTAVEPRAGAQDNTDLSPWLLWSNLAWAGLCGLLALAWWRARLHPATEEPAASASPDTPNWQDAERRLEQACRQGNPAQIRRAILDWADACQLTGSQAPSLAGIAALGDAALQAELAALDRALFAPEAAAKAAPDAGPDTASKAKTAVNAERLISGFKALHGSAGRTGTSAALAELYPQ